MRESVSSRPSTATDSKMPGDTVVPLIATRTGWNTLAGLAPLLSTTWRSATSTFSTVNGSAPARASRAAFRDSTPPFARLEPYRSRFRAGFGTLLAFCRLPGGRRARTLAPLLIAGEHSTRSAGRQLGAYNLLWSMKKEFNVVVERDREGYYVASIPALRGCHTQAKSLDELMERIREAAELCLEVQGEDTEGLEFIGVQRLTLA